MIQLSPNIQLELECPSCGRPVTPSDWKHTGMRIMLDCRCTGCGADFLSEAPINSALFYPGIIDKASGRRIDKLPFDNWYLTGLEEAYAARKDDPVSIVVKKNKELGDKPVLLLNTIDATYGHALFELFNASYYLGKTNFDLVIIVQKNMAWLVPDGAAQVWVADISFGKANSWLTGMDSAIKKLLEGIKEVYVCRSFVQTDSTDYNIEDYCRVRPFPLEEWDDRLEKPTITFIWRHDRFWKPVLPRLINNRYTRKIFPRLLVKLGNWVQFRWILRFSRELKKQVPQVDFAIAGMDDRTPPLPEWIKDFRYPVHEDETAHLQVKRYSESHLVMGCNGSSLLLPGSLAGSVINIVPGDLWSVSAGTFPFRMTSIGDTHYRYVMLPAEVSIKRLVNIAVSLLRDRTYVELQTSAPWRDHDSNLSPYDWSHQRVKSFLVSKHFSSSKGLITASKKDK